MGKLQMSVLIQLTNTVTAKPPQKTVLPIQIDDSRNNFSDAASNYNEASENLRMDITAGFLMA